MMLPIGFFEPHVATFLSPTNKDASFTLSNGNLTWAGGGGSGGASWISGLSTARLRTAERYYCEWTLIAPGTDSNWGVGFANTLAPITDYIGADTNGISYYAGVGAWSYGGGGAGTGLPATPIANDVICLALDGVNKTIWCRLNNGSWFGSGTGDPATNTNGFPCPNVFNTKILIGYTSNNTGSSARLNAGSSAFAFTPPVGFRSPNSCAEAGV